MPSARCAAPRAAPAEVLAAVRTACSPRSLRADLPSFPTGPPQPRYFPAAGGLTPGYISHTRSQPHSHCPAPRSCAPLPKYAPWTASASARSTTASNCRLPETTCPTRSRCAPRRDHESVSPLEFASVLGQAVVENLLAEPNLRNTTDRLWL
jgi:hypothetical protein